MTTNIANLDNLVRELSNLTVLQAADLAKKLEEHWGVSASAAVAVAAMPVAVAEVAVVKTEFDVVLMSIPADKKLTIIKIVRELDPKIMLTDAKKYVENLPYTLKEAVSKEEAEKTKQALEKEGAVVEIK